MTIGTKQFIDCPDCPYCKPQGVREKGMYGEGFKYGICGQGGNIVFLEPWREWRLCGSGYIRHKVSSCGLYEVRE